MTAQSHVKPLDGACVANKVAYGAALTSTEQDLCRCEPPNCGFLASAERQNWILTWAALYASRVCSAASFRSVPGLELRQVAVVIALHLEVEDTFDSPEAAVGNKVIVQQLQDAATDIAELLLDLQSTISEVQARTSSSNGQNQALVQNRFQLPAKTGSQQATIYFPDRRRR